jgi:Protein of unknown function (DUF2878)
MSSTSKIAYAVAFQIGWFVCILGDKDSVIAYTLGFVAAHFIFLKITLNKILWLKESSWLLLVFISGGLLETLVFSAGFLYSSSSHLYFDHIVPPPVWLLCLWLLFALALRTFMSFVFSAPKITYLTSTIAIPLNYYAGAQLNSDVNLNSPYILNLALISVLWVVLLWCLVQAKHSYFEDIFNAR